MVNSHSYFSNWQQLGFELCICRAPQDAPKTIAKMISLAKIAELRESKQGHGLKDREDYERAKGNFIATRNLGQKPQQTETAHDLPKTTTETMTDNTVKKF